jgi:hypothetical protein
MDDGVGVSLPINMDYTLLKRDDSQVATTPPTVSPRRTRGPSSPACVASFSVRVDTLEVLHLEHLDRTSHTCRSRRTWATTLRATLDAFVYIETIPLHLRV